MNILLLENDRTRIDCFEQKLSGHGIFYARDAEEAIRFLERYETFDQIYLNDEYKVALWIKSNPNKKPYRIVIHGFSVPGAQAILNILPEASFIPGVWLLDRMEF